MAEQFSREELEVARYMSAEDFYFFSRWMFMRRKGYPWMKADHHKVVCDALTAVFNGEIKNLIINIPPRYSKTELLINWLDWTIGKVPDSEFIYTSYSGTLAANSSWQAREMVLHQDYQAIFPDVKLRSDKSAMHEWRTTAGGIVYAVGEGGTITGYGAGKHRQGFGGAIVIDDPHKADEARSKTIRSGVIDWFLNTLESRRNYPDKTPMVLIMQRLHEDDLTGFLLRGGNGETWEHICLEALRGDEKTGYTALWPEKHSVKMLQQMQDAKPYTFAGQYQQKPAPLAGGIFKPDRLIEVDSVPAMENIQWVRGWDLASTMDGDWTAGAKLGRLPDGRFIIADMKRARAMSDDRDMLMKAVTQADGIKVVQDIPQDPGQAGKTQVAYLTKMLAGYKVESSPESGDKIDRAESFAAQVNIFNVLIVKGEWNDALREEMRNFPNGSNDDQIDALSRAFSHFVVRNGWAV